MKDLILALVAVVPISAAITQSDNDAVTAPAADAAAIEQSASDVAQKSWQDAYSEALRLQGRGDADWQLPSLDELRAMVRDRQQQARRGDRGPGHAGMSRPPHHGMQRGHRGSDQEGQMRGPQGMPPPHMMGPPPHMRGPQQQHRHGQQGMPPQAQRGPQGMPPHMMGPPPHMRGPQGGPQAHGQQGMQPPMRGGSYGMPPHRMGPPPQMQGPQAPHANRGPETSCTCTGKQAR